jgi:hypothetical protein
MTTTAVKSAGTTQAPLREKPLMTAMAEPDAGFPPDRSTASAGGLARTAAASGAIAWCGRSRMLGSSSA